MTYSISIGEPEVVGSRVEVDVTTSRRLRRFLSEDTFWVEYDESVEECPDGILVVPAIVTLAPIAWAAGATITVDEIDSTFAESLPELFSAYQEQYPSIFTEEVEPVQYSQACDYEPPQEQSSTSSATLFSGGVDSLTSYLKHRDEGPALFTIHGSDLGLEYDQGWQRIQDSVKLFAADEKVPVHTLKSNFRDILSYTFLNYHFVSEENRSWWPAVQCGTAMPALCVPVAYINGYEFLYEGSGYTSDPDYPAPQPSFVNPLSWGETKVKITEVGMGRQDKIKYLADNLDRFASSITIRSCYSDEAGQNCSNCEKCRRTFLGLCVEGVDPNPFGYNVDEENLDAIRNDLRNGEMSLARVDQRMWNNIQERACNNDNMYLQESEFYGWFTDADLSNFVGDGNDQNANVIADLVQNFILTMPYPIDKYLWEISKPVKQKLPM